MLYMYFAHVKHVHVWRYIINTNSLIMPQAYSLTPLSVSLCLLFSDNSLLFLMRIVT